MKERVRDIAAELIRIAAARELKSLPPVEPPHGLYDEFCARFPYQETEDQEKAIADTIADLAQGPADGPAGLRRCRLRQDRSGAARRLCRRHGGRAGGGGGADHACWRASIIAALPNASPAFRVKVRQLSRFVDAKEARETKEALADGTVDIVVGTHALLAESISFKRLGLVIVDEEQHFGVVHKERLKNLKADVHVLTLTATPIPAHPATGAVGRARPVADHHAADRPAGGAHLRDAVRSAGGARGAAARALSRRPELLCRARASPICARRRRS